MTTKCNLKKLIFPKTSEEKGFLMKIYILSLSHASINVLISMIQKMFYRIIYSRRRIFYVPHLEYPVYGVSEWLPLLRKRLHYESAFHFISRLVLEIQHVERMTTCFWRKYEKNW